MHLDGARIFNACVATDIPPSEYARHFDSVSFCLSKGLGAPVGSLIAGSAEFIDRAHRYRKMFGGGMRQAGILAAAGLFALENNIDRLCEDHRNARRLAEGLSKVEGIAINIEHVETNMVYFDVSGMGLTAPEFSITLAQRGVLTLAETKTSIRAVTHLDVSAEQIEVAVDAASSAARRS